MILTKIQQEKIRREFKLSNREMDCLNAIFEGIVKDEEIAKELKIDIRTAKQYLHSIYLKTRTGKKISTLLKCIELLGLR